VWLGSKCAMWRLAAQLRGFDEQDGFHVHLASEPSALCCLQLYMHGMHCMSTQTGHCWLVPVIVGLPPFCDGRQDGLCRTRLAWAPSLRPLQIGNYQLAIADTCSLQEHRGARIAYCPGLEAQLI
jgi:hypothetical protein